MESTPGIVSCNKEKPRLKSLELVFEDKEKGGAFKWRGGTGEKLAIGDECWGETSALGKALGACIDDEGTLVNGVSSWLRGGLTVEE